MNEREIRKSSLGNTAGVSENPLGICPQTDGADQEIKSVRSGKVNNLSGGIARQQDSRTLLDRERRLEERVQFVSGKALLLFGNLGERPYAELTASWL